MLNEERMDEISARLQFSSQKSLGYIAWEARAFNL
jgi:hypothetical protein